MMGESIKYFDPFSTVLSYPGQDYHLRIEECRRALAEKHPEVAERLRLFEAAAAEQTTPQREELYIQTFDLNKLCTLDLGWHLFGEDYNRGLFLVKLRKEMQRLGIPESAELPDHLTHVLAILGRMDHAAAADFATSCVIPAVKKLGEGLKAKKGNPYTAVVEGLLELLEAECAQPLEEAYHG